MKIISVVMGIFISSVSLISNAKKVDIDLPIQGHEHIQISANQGSFAVLGWNKDYVKISGQLSNDLVVNNKGRKLKLALNSDKKSSPSDTLTINIPSTKKITANSDIANFSLININPQPKSENESDQAHSLGPNISIESIDGSVDVKNSSGNFNISTVNGDIDISNSRGMANIRSVSGNQKVNADFRTIASSNVSGQSSYKLNTLEKLNLNNVNGASSIESSISAGASIQIQSVSGDVELLIPETTSARFSLKSHQGGMITNSLKEGANLQDDTKSDHTIFTLDQASASISIDTLSGNINIAPKKSQFKINDDQAYDWSSVDTGILNFAFINPNHNIFDHKEIFIKQPEVHFDENWLKKYGKETTKQFQERITDEYAASLKRAVADKFSKNSHFTIIEQRKEGALVIIPKVFELYIDNPQVVGITDMMIATPAGNAKIDLVIFSPTDNSILALFMDKRSTGKPESIGAFRPKATNRRAFSKLFNNWAKDMMTLLSQ